MYKMETQLTESSVNVIIAVTIRSTWHVLEPVYIPRALNTEICLNRWVACLSHTWREENVETGLGTNEADWPRRVDIRKEEISDMAIF